MSQRVLLLGSTGSIGQNTLEVLAGLGDRYKLVGLAAGSRWKTLAEQARFWRPEAVAITDSTAADALQTALGGGSRVLAGTDALAELVDSVPCDVVVSAVVGAAGLPATLRAVELGRRVALANKEALVVAGSLIAPLARQTGSVLVPIDSEHSAVFQALQAGRHAEVHKIYLTASGGPFRTWDRERISAATLEDALNHPTWDMGPKITIDSATMMNKALEIIEAHWLFDVPSEKIDVLIHPESVVHSLVEYCDGSVIAQLGSPDMRTPIQYALTFPERVVCPSDALDLLMHGRLHFEPPDEEKFPALRLGHETARRGGTAGAVLNAANEAAVEMFRAGEIRFPDIAAVTEQALQRHEWKDRPSLDDLLAADRWARNEVAEYTAC
jgi:1-deoxy-D-xylulose-5-phosphate reductoisomerase